MSDSTQGTTLREDLAAAMQAIEERGDASTGATVETNDAPVIPDGASNAGFLEPDGASPARADGRDERGRFAAKQPEAAAGDTAAAASTGADQAPASAEGEGAGAGDVDAPRSWRAEAKALWENIPPAARAEIHRRERHVEEIAGRMDGERRFGREFAEIMRPHMETIHRFGVTPQVAVQTLLNNDRVLRFGTPEQKTAMARELVSGYGLDLNALLQPDPNFPQDPHVRALQAQIANMQRQIAAPAQAQQFAPLPAPPPDDTQTEIEAFRSDPAHPHFDQVMPTMLALIESGAASDLQGAYDQAVWASPALRSTLQGQAQPAAQRQAASHTAAARRAAVSVPASPGASGSSKPASLRDELAENMRRAGIQV